MNPVQTSDLSEQWHFIIRLFRARFWTLLTFLAVTLLMVVIGTSLQAPIFRAGATVLIDMEMPNVLTVSTTRDDSQLGQANYLTYADYYRTQVEIIQSRAIAQKVMHNLNLGSRKPYQNATDPVRLLLKHVTIEPVKQTRLAKIFVEDRSPKQAARIANEFALVFAEENLAKTVSNEAMTLMKNEYLKLQSKEAELSKRYKAKFPARARVRQQMAELAQAIQQEMERQLHAERLEAEGEIATTEKSVFERLRENSMIGGIRPNNIRVQDLAQAPVRRYKPQLGFNLMLGFIFGLLGGVGAAVVEELLDSSLKVPEDIERDSKLVYLGYVPAINGVHPSDETPSPEKSEKEELAHFHSVELESHSEAAEAYRSLRTNLLFAAPQGDARTLVVTSPASEEGKTTTTTNLGIALSQIGLKILLVDTDLRKPRLHQVFGLNQAPGLSEYLTGQAKLEKIIQPTGIKGLWVVTSGSIPPNPAELLGSPAMKEFLNSISTQFDRALLDAPPVLPVTDAVELAAMTKAVLAVAQSGKTPRQALHRLVAIVHGVQAKVFGVILNNVPPRNLPVYGYGYRSYRYGGPPSKEEKNENPEADSHFQPFSSLIQRFKSNRDLARLKEKEIPSSRLTQQDVKAR